MRRFFISFTQFCFFFLAFTLDLQLVPAKSTKAKKEEHVLVELPKNCQSMHKSPCAIHFKKGKSLHLDYPHVLITLRENSTLFISQGIFHLVEGVFFVQAKQSLSLKSFNSEISLYEGLAFFEVEEEKVSAINVSSPQLKLKHLGEKRPLVLPPGYQTWMGGFTSSKKNISSLIGVPRAAHFKQFFSHWIEIKEKNKKEFKKDSHKFQEDWKRSIQEISSWHKSLVEEKLKNL